MNDRHEPDDHSPGREPKWRRVEVHGKASQAFPQQIYVYKKDKAHQGPVKNCGRGGQGSRPRRPGACPFTLTGVRWVLRFCIYPRPRLGLMDSYGSLAQGCLKPRTAQTSG